MYNGNFYNPYMFGSYQTASKLGSSGIGLKGLFRGFNFNNFLTSTGKTLNVINQAIPIFYQIKPIFNNAKTMLKVIGAVKDSKPKDIQQPTASVKTNDTKTNYTTVNSANNSSNNNPTFFL